MIDEVHCGVLEPSTRVLTLLTGDVKGRLPAIWGINLFILHDDGRVKVSRTRDRDLYNI